MDCIRYARGKDGLPGPEGQHECEPSKGEDSSIDIDRIQAGDRTCFPVDRVDNRRPPQGSEVEHGVGVEGQAIGRELHNPTAVKYRTSNVERRMSNVEPRSRMRDARAW